MKIEQMKMILNVAENASVSQAANRLFISQPALSKSIRAAEDELGQPLFKRDKSGMQLTEYGKIFCSKAREIVDSYDYLKSLALQEIQWEFPRLRVSACPVRHAGWAFFEYARQYSLSGSEFRFVSGNSSGAVSDVANGISDVGVISVALPVMDQVIAELDKVDVAYEPLRQADPLIFVSNDCPLAASGRETIRCEDLKKMTLFSIYEDLPVFERMNQEILSILGLDTAQYTVYYDPRAGLSDLIRPNEFRCNLGTVDVYSRTDTVHTLHRVGKSFRLDPVPFRFEVGIIRHKDAEYNPIAEGYIQKLKEIFVDPSPER